MRPRESGEVQTRAGVSTFAAAENTLPCMIRSVGDEEPKASAIDLVAGYFEHGRSAWPAIDLDIDTFRRYFARHASERIPGDDRAADMYLACACGYGVDGAVGALEHAFSRDIASAVASINPSPSFVEEALQVTRLRLFTRSGPAPGAIADYAGRASLRSWLRTVFVRSAISMRRRKAEQRHEPVTDQSDQRLARSGPEFEYLLRRYKEVFEDAIRSAIETLSPKERMLLRLSVVEGMSVDQLGAAYRVGRSTAARWIAAARATLFERARREVHEQVLVTSSELDSLATALRSQFEVNVGDLLRSRKADSVARTNPRT